MRHEMLLQIRVNSLYLALSPVLAHPQANRSLVHFTGSPPLAVLVNLRSTKHLGISRKSNGVKM